MISTDLDIVAPSYGIINLKKYYITANYYIYRIGPPGQKNKLTTKSKFLQKVLELSKKKQSGPLASQPPH
jgi:hypothetical protein